MEFNDSLRWRLNTERAGRTAAIFDINDTF